MVIVYTVPFHKNNLMLYFDVQFAENTGKEYILFKGPNSGNYEDIKQEFIATYK